jgi:membrane dipeptidase
MYIDPHLDTFYHMVENNRSFDDNPDQSGHVDLLRARKGELLAGFFTGFPNCTYYFDPVNKYSPKYKLPREDFSDAELTDDYLARWLKIVNDSKNSLTQIFSINDLESLKVSYLDSGKPKNIGAILHFEGASGIDSRLDRLYIFYALGLRSIGITWNETNQFATGVPGDVNRGFTQVGKDLLDAMESLGIIIDVSHLNDKSFWDLHSHTNKPFIASHSNLRKRANHMRNLTDEMVKAIAESDGSIGINFYTGFLSTDPDHKVNRKCTFEMIKEIINLTGSVNHVHIGSDFDGCQTSSDLKDVSVMPDYFSELQEYLQLSDIEIKKIQFENLSRVMKKIWK